jgi:hypothetical protein
LDARFDLLQPFHYRESVHAGHSKLEQELAVAVVAVKLAHLAQIHCGDDRNTVRAALHPFEHKQIGFQIVDDQNFAVKKVR